MELDPNAAAFHQSFAFVLYQSRRFEECLAENNLVYDLDPDYPLSLYVESRALCALGRADSTLTSVAEREPGQSRFAARSP